MRTRIALAAAAVAALSLGVSDIVLSAAAHPAAADAGIQSTAAIVVSPHGGTVAVPLALSIAGPEKGRRPARSAAGGSVGGWSVAPGVRLAAAAIATTMGRERAELFEERDDPSQRQAALPPAPPAQPITDWTSVWTPDWQCIRIHESGDQFNDPAAPSGAYGIVEETWESFGFSGWPYEASPAVQNFVALELYRRWGWSPWSSRWACGL